MKRVVLLAACLLASELHADTTQPRANVDHLIAGLSHADSQVRADSARALGEIESASPEAEAALVRALMDEAAAVRSTANASLVKLGLPVRDEVIRAIESVLGHYSSSSFAAVHQLGKLPSSERGVVMSMAFSLHADYAESRRAAARYLGGWGDAAKPAISDLATALSDPSRNVRIQAAESLGTIGRETGETAEALVPALRDEDWLVRHTTAYALRAMGPKAAAAVPALEETADDDPHDLVREAAQLALGDIAPEPTSPQTLLQVTVPPHP
ncbi:MAG: HEAT repeat domain-containing protein [Candidatus Hydrogenedentota bacterium]